MDADNVAVKSGSIKIRAPWGQDVPVTFRIVIAGTVGSGHLRVRPPHRSLWRWLARREAPAAAR